VSFQETWGSATVNEGETNNTPPPEGSYELLLKGAGAFTSKQGNDVMRMEWEVVSVAETGYEWSEIRGFGTQKQANAAKSTCHRLGINVEQIASLDELDTALKNLIGGYFSVNVVQNGEYRNVYVEAPSGSPTPPSDEPEFQPAPVADEDIPF
jgi:hypothetical protein